MNEREKLISGKDDIYPAYNGYSRLERLMQGNEEEHRRQDRTYLWVFIIICFAIFTAAIKSKNSEDDIKAKAAAAIDRYVQQTYGEEFDRFVPYDHINTYTYNGQLTLLSRGYTDPDWPDGSFSIAVDTDYNIARDGYRTNYLKGSVIFSSLGYSYSREGWSVESGYRIAASDKGLITMTDNIYIRADFSRKDDLYTHESYSFNDSGIYTGPVLSLDNPPTMNQLAQEYGLIELEINLAKPTQQRFEEIIMSFCDYLEEKDMCFNRMDIVINSKADMGNQKKFSFTYDDITSRNFAEILAEYIG